MIGVPVREAEGRTYNAVVSLSDPSGFYYKRHLVPFGEYVPFRDLLGSALDVLGAPMSDFTPGREAHVLNAAGVPVGALICYEAVFGAEVTELLPEAQLLVNVSNDAWFGSSLGPSSISRWHACVPSKPDVTFFEPRTPVSQQPSIMRAKCSSVLRSSKWPPSAPK